MIGENEKIGGFGGEGLYPEDGFLKQGFGRDEFEKVFGFGFPAQGPEPFTTATGHDEEQERGHGHKIKMKIKTKGAGNMRGRRVGQPVPWWPRKNSIDRMVREAG